MTKLLLHFENGKLVIPEVGRFYKTLWDPDTIMCNFKVFMDKVCEATTVYLIKTKHPIDYFVHTELSYRGRLEHSDGAYLKYTLISEEQMYLDLMRDIMEHGILSVDRTLVGTKSLFGRDLEFS